MHTATPAQTAAFLRFQAIVVFRMVDHPLRNQIALGLTLGPEVKEGTRYPLVSARQIFTQDKR